MKLRSLFDAKDKLERDEVELQQTEDKIQAIGKEIEVRQHLGR